MSASATPGVGDQARRMSAILEAQATVAICELNPAAVNDRTMPMLQTAEQTCARVLAELRPAQPPASGTAPAALSADVTAAIALAQDVQRRAQTVVQAALQRMQQAQAEAQRMVHHSVARISAAPSGDGDVRGGQDKYDSNYNSKHDAPPHDTRPAGATARQLSTPHTPVVLDGLLIPNSSGSLTDSRCGATASSSNSSSVSATSSSSTATQPADAAAPVSVLPAGRLEELHVQYTNPNDVQTALRGLRHTVIVPELSTTRGEGNPRTKLANALRDALRDAAGGYTAIVLNPFACRESRQLTHREIGAICHDVVTTSPYAQDFLTIVLTVPPSDKNRFANFRAFAFPFAHDDPRIHIYNEGGTELTADYLRQLAAREPTAPTSPRPTGVRSSGSAATAGSTREQKGARGGLRGDVDDDEPQSTTRNHKHKAPTRRAVRKTGDSARRSPTTSHGTASGTASEGAARRTPPPSAGAAAAAAATVSPETHPATTAATARPPSAAPRPHTATTAATERPRTASRTSATGNSASPMKTNRTVPRYRF